MTAYSRIEDIPLFKYGLIMADPPWRFDHWGDGTDRGPDYQTMTLPEIIDLPVRNLLAPDAYLVLWCHPSFPPSQWETVLKAWGCNFVTTGFWVKTQKADPTKPKMGLGRVLRDCGEPFIIGSVGEPGVRNKGLRGVLMAPRRENSRKPEVAYQLCEDLAPRGAWLLDLFSRQERPGWDCFGNETDHYEAA